MAAGPAAVTQHIASQFGVDDDAPCADLAYLAPLKRSAEFRGLRSRLAGAAPHHPVDAWQDGPFHFFVFALAPVGGASPEPPVAVFAMHPEAESRPASAVAVTLLHTGEAEVEDLHDPTNFYRVRLPVPPPVPDR